MRKPIVLTCLLTSLPVLLWYADRDPIGIITPERSLVEESQASSEIHSPSAAEKDRTMVPSVVSQQAREYLKVFRVEPLPFYQKNIDLANAGDPDAQFQVAYVLGACSSPSIANTGELLELEAQGLISRVEAAEWQTRLSLCEKLYEHAGTTNLEHLQASWIETAADLGHPIAKLSSVLYSPNPSGSPVPSSLVRQALSYRTGHPIEREESVRLALKHYRWYREKPDQRLVNPIETNAWDLLSCSVEYRCEVEDYHRLMNTYYFDYQVKESIELADRMRMALTNQDWQTLGLNDD